MERRDECEKSKGMATAQEIDPFLKTDLPTRAPKHHGQSLPRRAPGFLPYDIGARSHMSYKLTRNAKMANLKGKCALGPFLSILVIKCQHKWFKCETMPNGG
jgi:hypothetical protein